MDITPSSTEEFSHGFINTLEHKGQKFIASSIENEVTLPATQNNFDAITNSVNDNAIIDTQERSDLSPIMPPEEWEMELDEYKIIDKIDTTLQNSLTHESLTSTITSTTKSFNEPVQTVVENVAPSLVTLNTTHIEPTSLSSTTSISHSILSSVTTIPANNITSTPSKIMVQSRRTPSQMIVSESTIIDNNLEGSLEPSIPSPPQILSQPIPSGKSWLYDGLQSIINSQILPDQHSQRELSEKKLSLSSFDTTSTFVPATFSTAINNKYSLPVTTTVMNTSKKPPPMSTNDPTIWSTSTQTLSPNAIDITFSNNELQTKKSVGKPEKFMKESEENHYFNADSSIFMNAPSFHNQTRPILSHDRIRTDKINTMTQQLKFALNGTRETEKVRNEGKIDAMNLSLKSSTPMQNFDNTPVNSVILKSGNDVLHQFATTTQEASTEISTSTEQPISQEASTETNQNHRVSTVESHSLHSLKHQQLQQSLPGNLNEITGQQFTVAHDTQVAQSTSFSATVKQGSLLFITF